jgi:hypothetical protein
VTALGYSQRIVGHPNEILSEPTRYYSKGNLLSLQNTLVKKDFQNFSKIYSKDEVGIAGLMALPGMSGGPVVNSRGELLGTSFVSSYYGQDRSFTGFVRADYVYKELVEKYGVEQANQVFSCPAQ